MPNSLCPCGHPIIEHSGLGCTCNVVDETGINTFCKCNVSGKQLAKEAETELLLLRERVEKLEAKLKQRPEKVVIPESLVNWR